MIWRLSIKMFVTPSSPQLSRISFWNLVSFIHFHVLLFKTVWIRFVSATFCIFSHYLFWSPSIIFLVSRGRQFMILLAHLCGCCFARCSALRHLSSAVLLSKSVSFVLFRISSFYTLCFRLILIIIPSNALCAICILVVDICVIAIISRPYVWNGYKHD